MSNNYVNKFFGVSTASALAESGSVRRSTVTNKRFNPITIEAKIAPTSGNKIKVYL